jgi:hypothetical protein
MEPRELLRDTSEPIPLEPVREAERQGGLEILGGVTSRPYSSPREISEVPLLSVALGLLAAGGLGLLMFVATRFVYVYILYNSLIGMAVAAAIGVGYRQEHRQGKEVKASLLLVISCCLAAYWSFNFAWMALTADSIPISGSHAT